MRIAVLFLVAALGLAAGCTTTQTGPNAPSDAPVRKASTYDGEGDPKIKFKSDNGDAGGGETSGGPSAISYVVAPLSNIIYIPWKLIGGGAKGASDGVSAGFSKDRMPILGVVFAPINLVVGFLTGAVETVALSPVFIGPGDSFGHAMAQPTRHATAIWWYE